VLQLVLEQPEQLDEPEEGVKSKLPLLLNPQVDMRRFTSSPLQRGHDTLSSLPNTMVSNSSLHFEHLNS
jgi:hypothetical protein